MPWGALEVSRAVQAVIQGRPADEQVIITAPSSRFDLERRATLFEGGITIDWGVTRITAERLEVQETPTGRRGRAEGQVQLTDPDGTLQAADLELEWNTGGGFASARARTVQVLLAGVRVRAASLSITPSEWRFEQVTITNCGLRKPVYEVRTPLLVVTPGQRGRATKPRLNILGSQIATLPTLSFNLDRRVAGLRLPGIDYRPDRGLGVTWNSEILLNERTSVQGLFGAFENFRPNFGVNLTRSFANPVGNQFLMTPRSDMTERFQYGFFEAIDVLGSQGERKFLSNPRDAVSLSTQWNEVPQARFSSAPLSRAVDVTYEKGGAIGKFAHLSHMRGQLVREREDPFIARGVASTSLLFPDMKLGRQLTSYSRLDASLFGGKDVFGWTRATVGVVYEPKPYLKLSTALTGGFEGGTPDFLADRLLSKNAAILRLDYSLGPRRFSAMTRYDAALRWYTTEFAATQTIGCIDVFLLSRRMPREYRIGIRLRLDNFLNLFQRRNPNRGPNGSFFSKRTGPR